VGDSAKKKKPALRKRKKRKDFQRGLGSLPKELLAGKAKKGNVLSPWHKVATG